MLIRIERVDTLGGQPIVFFSHSAGNCAAQWSAQEIPLVGQELTVELDLLGDISIDRLDESQLYEPTQAMTVTANGKVVIRAQVIEFEPLVAVWLRIAKDCILRVARVGRNLQVGDIISFSVDSSSLCATVLGGDSPFTRRELPKFSEEEAVVLRTIGENDGELAQLAKLRFTYGLDLETAKKVLTRLNV
jgi:hypothetical protein